MVWTSTQSGDLSGDIRGGFFFFSFSLFFCLLFSRLFILLQPPFKSPSSHTSIPWREAFGVDPSIPFSLDLPLVLLPPTPPPFPWDSTTCCRTQGPFSSFPLSLPALPSIPSPFLYVTCQATGTLSTQAHRAETQAICILLFCSL